MERYDTSTVVRNIIGKISQSAPFSKPTLHSTKLNVVEYIMGKNHIIPMAAK
jgi:hypothetical protein